MTSLTNIDLNLLMLFSVLYETKSVSLTAERLNLSQSACSHALTRLRERLADELFVRVGNSMLPTEYAQHLIQYVAPALDMVDSGLQARHDFSAHEAHSFKVAVTDYTAWCLRPFIEHLSREFVNIQIEFVQLEERLPSTLLEEGGLDFVCGFEHQVDAQMEGLAHFIWLEDYYVSVHARQFDMSKDGTLTLANFLSYQHVLVTPWNESRGIVDISLARLKKKRVVAIKTASVLAAPYFVQHSPYFLACPNHYVEEMKDRLDLVVNEMPIPVPSYKLALYWHKTRTHSEKTHWFIEQFRTCFPAT